MGEIKTSGSQSLEIGPSPPSTWQKCSLSFSWETEDAQCRTFLREAVGMAGLHPVSAEELLAR